MATEVELSGMTINLVPDKETYEGMVKNPNEIYLVQNDYDMIIEFHQIQGTSVVTGSVVNGSLDSIVSRLTSDPYYQPKIFATGSLYYSTTLISYRQIVQPIVFHYANETYEMSFSLSGFGNIRLEVLQNNSVGVYFDFTG